MTPTSRTKNFFISYNKHDSAWAEWIAWQLEDVGYSTIIQAWDFGAGRNFTLEMHEGLKHAERLIAVLSPSYFNSGFTPPEWAAKFVQDPTGEKGQVVPVRVQTVSLDGLFSAIIYIDLVGRDEGAAKETLLKYLRHERAKPDRSPRYPGPRSKPSYPGLDPVEFRAVITGTIAQKDTAIIEAMVEHLRKISGDISLTLMAVRGESVVPVPAVEVDVMLNDDVGDFSITKDIAERELHDFPPPIREISPDEWI